MNKHTLVSMIGFIFGFQDQTTKNYETGYLKNLKDFVIFVMFIMKRNTVSYMLKILEMPLFSQFKINLLYNL